MKLALGLLVAGLLFAQSSETGTIEGVVVNSVTRAPVRGAIVTAWILRSPGPNAPPEATPQRPERVSARTDAAGSFVLRNMPAGTHHVSVQHPRYLNQRGSPAAEVRPGQTASVRAELIPGASITGRVTDEYGDPLAGCVPTLLPVRRGQGLEYRGSQISDSRGNFAVWGVGAGKVRLLLRCGGHIPEPFPLRPLNAPRLAPTMGWPPLFYPGVRSLQEAQVIEVEAGAEKAGFDFQMKPAAVHTLAGTLRPAGDYLKESHLTLLPRDATTRQATGGTGGWIDARDGTFRVERTFPGDYTLHVILRERGRPIATARAAVTVPEAEPVQLELKSAVDLDGRVEIEGDSKQPLNQMTVQLLELEEVGAAPGQVTLREDGTFTIAGVLPGIYRVEVFGNGVYAKAASAGGQDLPGRVLDMTAGSPGSLHIVLSTDLGTIRGTAPKGSYVSAVETSTRMHMHSGGAPVQADGTFSFAVRPGSYHVTVAGDAETAQEVEVAEGETATVNFPEPKR